LLTVLALDTNREFDRWDLQLIRREGVTNAIVGGGGGRLHPARVDPGTCFRVESFGFALLRVTRERIALEFYDARARSLHGWRYPRRGECSH
jgi:hypothetical protein